MGTAGQRCTTLRRLFVHESVYDALVARLQARLRVGRSAIPLEAGTLVGPLIDGAAFEAMQRALARRDGRRRPRARRRARRRDRRAGCAFYVRPALVRDAGADRPGAARDLRADPLRDALSRFRRGHRAAQRRAAGPVVVDLHQRPARGRAVPVGRAAPTAASPTSISDPPAPRSAAPSAARRRPAAAANPARTPGRPTCAAPPTRSITAARCRSPRASSSTWTDWDMVGERRL